MNFLNIIFLLCSETFTMKNIFKYELQDIEKLTEERIDQIIQRFLMEFKAAKLHENGWPLTMSAYKLSKAALNAYSRLTAKNFPNIIVNCVHPGYVVTYMTSQTGFINALKVE